MKEWHPGGIHWEWQEISKKTERKDKKVEEKVAPVQQQAWWLIPLSLFPLRDQWHAITLYSNLSLSLSLVACLWLEGTSGKPEESREFSPQSFYVVCDHHTLSHGTHMRNVLTLKTVRWLVKAAYAYKSIAQRSQSRLKPISSSQCKAPLVWERWHHSLGIFSKTCNQGSYLETWIWIPDVVLLSKPLRMLAQPLGAIWHWAP